MSVGLPVSCGSEMVMRYVAFASHFGALADGSKPTKRLKLVVCWWPGTGCTGTAKRYRDLGL
jgi:hypothetical protein